MALSGPADAFSLLPRVRAALDLADLFQPPAPKGL